MTTKLMGQKVQRVEDERLLLGRGRYVDDVLPGALEAAVLRSPHAHARLAALDAAEGLSAVSGAVGRARSGAEPTWNRTLSLIHSVLSCPAAFCR